MRGVAARSMPTALLYLALIAVHAGEVHAGEDDDAAALTLTGASAPPAAAGSAAFFAETAYTEAQPRAGGSADAQRLSLEGSDDVRFAPQWRFVFADRLDLDWSGSWAGSQQVNTLKQAYLSWQPAAELLWDAGRVNVRQGVGYGFNPTDFFRAGALRSVESLDPNSLRDERLGTVMVRAETLWTNGALTALYAPRLARGPDNAPLSPDLGATNAAGRWLISLTQRLAGGFSPQWLLFGTDGGAAQAGVNATTLLGGATVAFLEASAGRSPSLYAEALDLPGAEALRARASAGFTYSARNKLSITLEYEYDGAAPGRNGWDALRAGDPENYGRYREFALAQQELTTRQSVFAFAAWQDLGLRHLDWTAFVRVDLVDHSRLPWTELRYHWSHIDAAIRWQDYVGGATTDFGAASTRQTWQAVFDYYLAL